MIFSLRPYRNERIQQMLQSTCLQWMNVCKDYSKLQSVGPLHGGLLNNQWLRGSRVSDPDAQGLTRDYGIIAEDPTSHPG